ncbi:hypothetical protein G7A72_12440 [Flavobacterium sp. Sr18]|uniref:hypothetical protein n=1 Tax=Flavobacterium sp. Sr18 TaxID=935222 RepID=UPI0013E44E40|nr:hypothetical protein [Flavobacterium sp. Sr18]QIH39566.1 hypothetical protein G7A72_12440 [Flavobacterium sp. Sr18]
MVSITSNEDEFIFDIQGSHKFWAFENKIRVPKDKIIRAYQSKDEFTFWIGWKMPGTQLPWVITAGTYIKNGKRNFWDVCNKKNAIIVELKDSHYHKLIIEVENPELTMNELNAK